MKQLVLNNWSFNRALRLTAGIAIIVQAVIAKDFLPGFAGLVFTSMAVFNIGCCGTGCYTHNKKDTIAAEDTGYEEVV